MLVSDNTDFGNGDPLVIRLRYGNTNTFFIRGIHGNLLVDTDMAGTLPLFYKAIKADDIRIRDIDYVFATHYHPDHMGLIGSLMEQGVRLLIVEEQLPYVHDSDGIFAKEKGVEYVPISEDKAIMIKCSESRAFLHQLGIEGALCYTPSHSPDSVSLFLDDGNCFVGDLEPIDYVDGYEYNPQLHADWELVLEHEPSVVYYAHAPAWVL